MILFFWGDKQISYWYANETYLFLVLCQFVSEWAIHAGKGFVHLCSPNYWLLYAPFIAIINYPKRSTSQIFHSISLFISNIDWEDYNFSGMSDLVIRKSKLMKQVRQEQKHKYLQKLRE